MSNDIYGEDHTLNKSQIERFNCAIQYTELGYPVLFTKGKRAITKNGVKDATTSTDELALQFLKDPKQMIAVATGIKFWVVDIDIKPTSGIDGYESLYDHFGDDFVVDTKKHLIQKTPSGGIHLFIELPDDGLPVPNTVGVLDGVDLRGLGTYVVMAPSGISIDGQYKQYRLRNAADGCFMPMCKWTTELLQMARDKKSTSNDGLLNEGLTTGFGQGVRDDSIFKLACMLKREGIDINVAEAFIQSVAEKCDPPFSPVVAVNKVQYVYNTTKQDTMEAVKTELRIRSNNQE